MKKVNHFKTSLYLFLALVLLMSATRPGPASGGGGKNPPFALADTTGLVSALAGKAASSHAHAAGDITSGTVATARLGSGTADSTTYLRGDQTWATVSTAATLGSCRYSGVAARGSTNTYNLRWSTANSACTGSDISYSASTTAGDSFSFATTGNYIVTLNLNAGSAFQAQINVGSSITNTLTTGDAEKRADCYFTAYHACTWAGPITSGQKLWVGTSAAPSNSEPNINMITITRLN